MNSFESVNRFFYFSMNYPVNFFRWTDMWGNIHEDYLPDFIMCIEWTCGHEHMINKWKRTESDFGSMGRMNAFYADIDSDNREILVNWIMENYHE